MLNPDSEREVGGLQRFPARDVNGDLKEFKDAVDKAVSVAATAYNQVGRVKQKIAQLERRLAQLERRPK